MFRILLPVEPTGAENRALAEAIVEMPLDRSKLEVVVLSVFEEQNIQDLDGGRLSSEEVFEMTDDPEGLETTAAYLEEHDIKTTKRREHGKPAQEILKIADDEGVQRIVMGGSKRSRVGKAVFGSVTQTVLLNSETPVTIVMDE